MWQMCDANAARWWSWTDEPVSTVQIVKHGRETAYLISSATYAELLAGYRRVVRVEELTEAEMAMIMDAEIPPEHQYEIDEPEADASSSSVRS